jgi:hypothetical protein
MTTKESLRSAAIKVLSEYIGAAAEFVVDDAWDEVGKNAAFLSNPDLQNRFFFVCLNKQLSPDVPYIKVKEAIAKAAGISI